MTAQEVIKKFMAALDLQNYSDSTAALDDAIRKSSRFNGVQGAIDAFLADKQAAERYAVKTILGDEYEGYQLSELIDNSATDSELAAKLSATDTYSDAPAHYLNRTFTAIQRIRMLTADTFLKEYCGIELDYYIGYDDKGATGKFASSTGNVDTGAITGFDAGGETVKDSSGIVPEIGNKYTAGTSTPQIITTGDNDWIVNGTDANDTIYAGGADSITAGNGADIVYVSGNYATVAAGNDSYADTISVASDVTNITISDLDEFDKVNLQNFTLGGATLTGDIVTAVDTTGKRTLKLSGWNTSKNAKVNNVTFGEWLSSFIESEEIESTATALISTETGAASVDLSEVTTLNGYFNAEGFSTLAAGAIGTVSADFPNLNTFTTHGLTVELWGNATNSEATSVTATTFDRLSNAQKTVFQGIYKWWIKEGLKLNEESFNLSFNTEGVTGSNIKVFFYSDNSGTLAFVRNSGSGKDLQLGVNMRYFSNIAESNVDGAAAIRTNQILNLDRTIAHELTHAVMVANVSNYNALPQFIKEGLAELVHGIDDERDTRIWDLAGGDSSTSRLSSALNLNNVSTGDDDSYAGGYMFLRYLAKQAAIDTADKIAIGDATINVSLDGSNQVYYANFNSTLEGATTVETEYKVGTAQNHNYSIEAGVTQHIRVTDAENWKFSELGSHNSLTAGAGNDSIYISQYDSDLYANAGNGDNRVTLISSAGNTIVSGSGADSVRIEYAEKNTVQTGAGNDTITFTSTNSSLNNIDGGAGDDKIFLYGNYNTINGGADSDEIEVHGNYNSVDGGAGDDIIAIYATDNTISGGAGDDYIEVTSTNNIVNGGAGNDDIKISATNNTVSGGTNSDYFIITSGVRQLHITDFSLSENDRLDLNYSVDYALFSGQTGAIILGDLNLYLDNLRQISDYFNMRIYLPESDEAVTLKSLLNANAFNWANGEYYFLVDNGVVNISAGELVYDKNKLQSGQEYAKVMIAGNALSIETDASADITITPNNNSARTLTINGADRYTFTGPAEINTSSLGTSATSGVFTIPNDSTFYFTEGDTSKFISYSGAAASSTLKFTLADAPTLILSANDNVTLNSGAVTDYYIANSSTVIKKTGTATFSDIGDILNEDIFTYRVSTYRFGTNIFDADFSTELNHYTENFSDGTLTFWSGTLDTGDFSFTLDNATDDSGITFIYSDGTLAGISADNFTEGESLTIGNINYTVTNGKIIRDTDGEPYNGDWNLFLANLSEEYYWGAISGWTIESGTAIYILEDEPVIYLRGLNLSGVEVVDGQIAQISLSSHTVNIADDLIRANQITVDGAGYEFNFNSTANVKVLSAVTTVTASSGNDIILADNIEHKNDNFRISASLGDDSIAVTNINQSGGTFNISAGDGSDLISADSVSVGSGSIFNLDANSGSDSISVSFVNVQGDGNFALNANDGDDFISASSLNNADGYIGIFGNEGNDTISISSFRADSESAFFISGDSYANYASVNSNDLIAVSNLTVDSGNVSVVGNSGNDTLNISNVTLYSGSFVIEGDYSGGTSFGDDLINISNSNGFKLISGNGVDTLVFAGDVHGTISDFSPNDVIKLDSPVNYAIFRNGTLSFDNISLSLTGVDDIYPFSSITVVNGASITTLGELISSGLSWDVSSGTAIFNHDYITVTGLSSIATP